VEQSDVDDHSVCTYGKTVWFASSLCLCVMVICLSVRQLSFMCVMCRRQRSFLLRSASADLQLLW